MKTIDSILSLITGEFYIAGLVLISLALIFFGIELFFWLGRYRKIAKYRNNRRGPESPIDGISVVVILGGENFRYLENTLPKLMGQQYPNFEIVIIQVSPSPEFSDEMEMLKTRYPNLTTATLHPDPRFRISDKMIYNIGIKTARYENIILTTDDAAPVSSKWLDCMSKGFSNGKVAIAYCGLERRKGLMNSIFRCSRLLTSIRYLSSGIAGKPYRGILSNLGISKSLYMDNRGFNYLDMTVGEDDLFIQKIATRENTSIVLNAHATLRQEIYGGFSEWWRMRKTRGITRRFYPGWAKRQVTMELLCRFLFMLCVILCGIFLPVYTALGAAALWLGRWAVVRHQVRRICRRLGERGLNWIILLYDLIEPFTAIAVSISRRIRPPKEMWK